VEEWKWRGAPLWPHGRILHTGKTCRTAVKRIFAKAVQLPHPACLFNASLEGNTRRSIDPHQGEKIDVAAFTALIRGAVNQSDPRQVPRLQVSSRRLGDNASPGSPQARGSRRSSAGWSR
jgi:hypothetical protein